MCTRHKDKHIREIIGLVDALLEKNPTAKCYIKWTCPRCGERVTSTTPNQFCAGGYTHEEKEDGTFCGGIYTGDMYGLMVVLGVH